MAASPTDALDCIECDTSVERGRQHEGPRCPPCGESIERPAIRREARTCPVCKGARRQEHLVTLMGDPVGTVKSDCQWCAGKGVVWGAK